MDPGSESGEEEWNDDGEPSSDEDEEGDSDEGLSTASGEDEEESDVDMDAPRVAQWVDDEDLEELETHSGDASHGKAADAEDIVRAVHVSPKFIVHFVL